MSIVDRITKSRVVIGSRFHLSISCAARFPSIKCVAMYQDSRTEFQENKNLTDAKLNDVKLFIARQCITQMAMYVDLDPKKANWSINFVKVTACDQDFSDPETYLNADMGRPTDKNAVSTRHNPCS